MDKLAHFQNALAERRVPALAELRARPILDQAGRPHVVAGNNALVARLKRADGGDVALRIVASDGKHRDWAVRYSAIAQFQESYELSRLPSAIRVVRDGLPQFNAAPAGVGSASIGIAMEWIQGPTLLQGIDRAARSGNVAVIRALSVAFVQMWNDLQAHGFSHGDYTSQNLLVRPNGQLACVDLDTASWTDAPLGPSGEGTPGYRHPTLYRDAAERDAFAALAIVTSLSVLSDMPELRDRFGDPPTSVDGTLLFAPWDLADPATSEAFALARRGASRRSGELLDALASACIGVASDVYDACSAIPRLQLPATFSTMPQPESTWDVGPIVARMRARYAETWEGAAPESDDREPAATRADAPAQATSPNEWSTWHSVDDAVTSRDIAELQAALERNDEVEVVCIWSQMGYDPIASLLSADVESVIAASYDRRVLAESRRKRDPAVVAVAEEARRRRIPIGQQSRDIVRQAQERLDVQALLDAALASGNRQQLADLAVSGQLVVLGDADRESLQQVLQAIEWPALQRAIQSDDDALIVAAFDAELFEGSSFLDTEVKARVDLARRRVQWLTQARTALRRRNTSTFRDLLVDPPEGAPERLSSPERRRIRKAIEQEQALADLNRVAQSSDDLAIISALNKVERVGARIPDRKTWAHIQRVVERVSIIDELLLASETQPLDDARIAQLLPAIRMLGLEHDPRLGDDRLVERLEEHVIKMAHVRRIRAAIARDNDVAIVSAAVPDPRNALDMLSEDERNRVAGAMQAGRSASRDRA